MSLSVHGKTLYQLNVALNEDLDCLNGWLMGSRLSLNIAKMHSMVLSTRQKERGLTNEYDLKVDNIRILTAEDTK